LGVFDGHAVLYDGYETGRAPSKETAMGIGSMWHWIIVALVVLVLFGRGKIAETMGDFGKGIRSFKRGIADEETAKPQLPGSAETPSADAARAASEPASRP